MTQAFPRLLPGTTHPGHSLGADNEDVVTGDGSEGKVLVVDDESSITELVSMALRYEGFTVETAGDGAGAQRLLATFSPDLVVLDVMLPDTDGFSLARGISRDAEPVPILFLTARDSTEDKIRGLTVGGDDYLTKPFAVGELVARVRAVLRRARGRESSGGNVLRLADLEMDTDTMIVRRGEDIIELTATEYRLLHFLLTHSRKVMSRAQILDHVWEYDFRGDAGILETYISYLRRKVDAGRAPLLQTVRGVGYVLREPRA
jgi:two-component system OmpR family response regulator